MTEKLNTDISDGIATITFTTPERHNAMDGEVIRKLDGVFEDYADRQDIRVVVMKGEGKSFCAGADINWMKEAGDYSADENIDDARMLADMLYKFYHLPQLTISCVQGRALGGGLGLVACSDIVLAERHASFALPEVKLGLIPATIAPYVMAAIGGRQARRYFQTGEKMTAQRAVDIGLVHELGEDMDEVNDLLSGLIENIRSNGPHAMRAAKKLCRDMAGRPIDDDIASETASRLAIVRSGDEAKEGLKAFLEKRKPGFAS